MSDDLLTIQPLPSEVAIAEVEQLLADLDRVRGRAYAADTAKLHALGDVAEQVLAVCRSIRRLPPNLDIAGGTVAWRGILVPTTPMDLRLTSYLAQRHGRSCSYRELNEAAHGRPFAGGRGDEGYRGNLRASMRRLRKRFQAVDPDFDRIEAQPGYGYRWKA